MANDQVSASDTDEKAREYFTDTLLTSYTGEKLKFYSLQENPLRFADKLKDYRFGNYRFRIGDYRVLFDVEDKKIIILKVGHRSDIYKDC